MLCFLNVPVTIQSDAKQVKQVQSDEAKNKKSVNGQQTDIKRNFGPLRESNPGPLPP